MQILRTAAARFRDLPDYPFTPHYHDVAPDLRLHYVDEGPRTAPPVLMLHGEPAWSYLYRKMIPPVAATGSRVLAPDLIGFGKSDKPGQRSDYTYAKHVAWVLHWIEALDLKGITLVCQDWGSLIGLRLAAEHPQRFDRIVLGNGGLPIGQTFSRAFNLWRAFAQRSPWFPIGGIVQRGTRRRLAPAERAAYDAPFPTEEYKAGARVFPSLVPITPDDPATGDNRRAWAVLMRWEKPFITCFSDGDPITRGGDRRFREHVPGARGQKHVTLHGGHFLQEDDPAGFANVIIGACAG